MLVELSEEQKALIKEKGIMVLKGGARCYYLPVWYKENADGTMDEYFLETIPETLREIVLTLSKDTE